MYKEEAAELLAVLDDGHARNINEYWQKQLRKALEFVLKHAPSLSITKTKKIAGN